MLPRSVVAKSFLDAFGHIWQQSKVLQELFTLLIGQRSPLSNPAGWRSLRHRGGVVTATGYRITAYR